MHAFTLILGGIADFRAASEALYAAGCDDALISRSDGVVSVDFDREAPTLVEAFSSAVQDIRRADIGATVIRVEDATPDPGGYASTINSVLQISRAIAINPELRPVVLELLDAMPSEALKEVHEQIQADVSRVPPSGAIQAKAVDLRKKTDESRSAAG
jgi:hypothetical protein